MNFNDMSIFVTIYETRSINKSSKILQYAQSNLSARLKVLETELDTKLFYRKYNGLVSTESGDLFYQFCKETSNKLEKLKKKCKTSKISILISELLFNHDINNSQTIDLDKSEINIQKTSDIPIIAHQEEFDKIFCFQKIENLKPYTHISTADKRAIVSSAKDEKLDYIIHKIDEYKMDVTTFLDKDFPSILNHIYNPPAILFMRGNRVLLDKRLNRIALVGARRCSLYGRNVARMLGKELGKYSTIIVSGGARGIDTHGHEGLLASQGYGIIVMGCGLDITYPRENAKLFDRMLQNNGLLLSEYPPGTPPSAKHFPARNRIISGLCRGVIVVEAKSSSGSLITADMAVSEGRDVFVVPCNLLDHTADGNKFLMKNGAYVLTGYEDIVEQYHLTMREYFSSEHKLLPTRTNRTGQRAYSW